MLLVCESYFCYLYEEDDYFQQCDYLDKPYHDVQQEEKSNNALLQGRHKPLLGKKQNQDQTGCL